MNQKKVLFKLKESKSALITFAIQYRIEGKDGVDPKSFLLKRSSL